MLSPFSSSQGLKVPTCGGMETTLNLNMRRIGCQCGTAGFHCSMLLINHSAPLIMKTPVLIIDATVRTRDM